LAGKDEALKKGREGGTLMSVEDTRQTWDNELHPTKMGFKAVTNKIAAELGKLS
jgi:hypothetical protein